MTTEQPDPQNDPELAAPDSARSERAADTPAQPDAEEMESALREGGALGPADEYAAQRRQAPTEPGPGTSLA